VKRRIVIDEGIGETRAALYEGRKLVELYLRRWSDKDAPRPGDIFAGRITKIDKSLGGAFVDLGGQRQGFLKFTMAPDAPRLTEGAMIKAEITREAMGGKSAGLTYLDTSTLTVPQPLIQISLHDFLTRRFGPGLKVEHAPLNHIYHAAEPLISLPGGGNISIERTRALIAIDVDKEGAQSGYEVSINAAKTIAQQLRLRGLGGIIAIDFPNIRQPKQREFLAGLMHDLTKNDPNPVKIAPLSRFGIMEMTRGVKTRSIDDVLYGRGTIPSAETLALQALQRLEREAASSPGAKLTLIVPEAASNWLSDDTIDWADAMPHKIGARFKVETGEKLDVVTDR
jgi:Ribonuclease G/E